MEAISETGPPAITDERTLADVETGYTYFRDGDIAIAKITPYFLKMASEPIFEIS